MKLLSWTLKKLLLSPHRTILSVVLGPFVVSTPGVVIWARFSSQAGVSRMVLNRMDIGALSAGTPSSYFRLLFLTNSTISSDTLKLGNKGFFISNNTTSFRTHIARYSSTHRSIYLEKCKEADITPRERAIGDTDESTYVISITFYAVSLKTLHVDKEL